MLDPREAGAIWQKHFDTVTDEEFIENVRRLDPEFADEIWGMPLAAGGTGSQRLDPQSARAILKEYATATDQQIVDDLWRDSPELARRLGVAPPGSQTAPVRREPRGFFTFLRRSVLRLFS